MTREQIQDNNNFSQGYIIISRSLLNSPIWSKPNHYLKVFIYLLSRAQHTDFRLLKRGQLVTSIPEIIEATSYYVGARKEKLKKHQVHDVIDWLRKPNEGLTKGYTKAPMIATTKATHGMLVTINNYAVYQDPKSYESNGESNGESSSKATRKQRHTNNINKNDKNVNNDKNENNGAFDDFWKLYPKKVGKKDCEKIFSKLEAEQIEKIMDHLPLYIPSTTFYFNPTNYLRGEHWADEIINRQNNGKATPNKLISQTTDYVKPF